MKHVTCGFLAAGLAAVLVTASPTAQADEPKANPDAAALEKLLKGIKPEVTYVRLGDGALRLKWEDDEGNVTLIVIEADTTMLGGAKEACIAVWSPITGVEGDKLPPAVEAGLTKMNSELGFGRLSVEKNPKGGFIVFLNYVFFLRNADSQELFNYIAMCFVARHKVLKELRRIKEEG